jgi:regulator of replication initiation timing
VKETANHERYSTNENYRNEENRAENLRLKNERSKQSARRSYARRSPHNRDAPSNLEDKRFDASVKPKSPIVAYSFDFHRPIRTPENSRKDLWQDSQEAKVNTAELLSTISELKTQVKDLKTKNLESARTVEHEKARTEEAKREASILQKNLRTMEKDYANIRAELQPINNRETKEVIGEFTMIKTRIEDFCSKTARSIVESLDMDCPYPSNSASPELVSLLGRASKMCYDLHFFGRQRTYDCLSCLSLVLGQLTRSIL